MKKLLVVFLSLGILFSLFAGCEQAPVESSTSETVSAASTPAISAVTDAVAETGEAGEPMTIRFFAGGEPGDAFASIVYKGAMDAAEMLKPYNVTVDYVFSGWDTEKMISQLREAIAAGPDAICMMGHPGDDAIMPLAEEAKNAGIIMMYQNVDVPVVRAQFGGGYVGVIDLSAQGRTLGEAAIRELGLQSGDRAVVFGSWGMPGRYQREEGTAQSFEDIGMVVERVVAPNESAADPQLLLPLISGQLQSHPETKIIVYAGAQGFSQVQTYMEACGKGPGDVLSIGFDLTPAIINGFKEGYIQMSSDQQPYLQGYLPVMSAYLTWKNQLSPLVFDTGAGLITAANSEQVAALVEEGIR